MRGGVAGSEAVVNWLDLKTKKKGGCGWLDMEFEEDFGVGEDPEVGDECGGGGRDKPLVSRVGSVYI